MTRRRLVLLALASLAAAVIIGGLDQESASFTAQFSGAGNIAGLALWAIGCFATGALVIASATPTHRS